VYLDETGIIQLEADQLDAGSQVSTCGILNPTTLSANTFSCQDIGPQQIMMTLSDDIGCSGSCMATVSIQDTIAPQFSCDDIYEMVLVWSGTEVYPESLMNQATDNCGGDVFECSFSEDFSSPSLTLSCTDKLEEDNWLTVYMRDEFGNVGSCYIQPLFLPEPMSESCECSAETLLLPDSIPADAYSAYSFIESDGIVNNGDTVRLKAGQQITLKPGFVARSGSSFAARIDNCEMTGQGVETESGSAVESRSDNIDSRNEELIMSAIWPNPFRRNFAVEFSLSSLQPISLRLQHINQSSSRLLIHNENFESGTHQLQVDGTALSPGIYLLILETPTNRSIQKIVKIN
jgi:hypothetical protein